MSIIDSIKNLFKTHQEFIENSNEDDNIHEDIVHEHEVANDGLTWRR